MTDDELLRLRQTADRDGDLTASARVLFGEIINLNLLGDGCYKDYTTLADDLGMNERTVRRRRDELENAGYLTIKHDGDRRYLVPTRPDSSVRTGQQCPDTDAEADTSDRTRVSASDTDDETPPDTSVHHRDIDNPAEAEESAPAGDGASGPVKIDNTFGVLVDIWRDVPGTPPMQDRHMKVFQRWSEEGLQVNPDLFRDVLRDQLDSTQGRGVGLDMSILRKEYEKERTEQTSKYMPSADPDLDV